MANKKYKKRQDRIFEGIAATAAFIALFISFIIAYASGAFNAKIFLIIFFVSLVILLVLYVVLSIPSVKGKIGELRVSKRIKKVAKRYNGKVIDDVTIPGENGKTSQIDHILLTPYDIFVIETKNYAGRIYGEDNQDNWTQVLVYGKSKHKLYNPVKQNATHIYRLKQIIDSSIKLQSVIVFVNGNISYINSEYVYTLGDLKYLVNRNSKKHIDSSQIEDIYNKLMEYKNNPIVSKKEHIEEIKKMKSDIDNNICPRCGAKLILRASKTNNNQFWGCSNYPNCKFTKKA